MTENKDKSDLLATHFKALRDRAEGPDEALLARVLADADAVQAATAAATAQRARAPDENLLARFLGVMDGWPAAAGLVTAGVAGLWIGVSDPGGLVTSSQDMLFSQGTTNLSLDSDPALEFLELDGGL